jgi:hypothetical protein
VWRVISLPLHCREFIAAIALITVAMAPHSTAQAQAVDADDDDATLKADATCKQAYKHVKLKGVDGLTASQLNTHGMRCYTHGSFRSAERLFEAAGQIDSSHALSQYNMACAMLRGATSEWPGERDMEVWVILEDVFLLEPARFDRFWSDSDFDGFRGRMNMPSAPMAANAVAHFFDGRELWGPTPGAGPTRYAKFARTHDTALTGTVRGKDWSYWGTDNLEDKGTWRAESGRIIVDWHGDTVRTEIIMPEGIGRYDPAYHDGWFGAPERHD